MGRTPPVSRRVCVAVVVDAGQLDELLKRLALDNLAASCGSWAADSSPSSQGHPEVPLLAWHQRWRVVAIVGMGLLGVALGWAAAAQSEAPRELHGPRTYETAAARLQEGDDRASSDAGIATGERPTQPAPEPVRAPVQPPAWRGRRAPTPSVLQDPAPRPIISAPRDEAQDRRGAGLDDGDYIREL